MQNAVTKLAALGAAPAKAPLPAGPLPTNTHIHLPPNFSAFDDLDEVLNLAVSEKIAVLGGSNYYDYSVYGPFVDGCLKRGIYPVMGAEILSWMEDLAQTGTLINDPGNPGKAYLVAKSLALLANPSTRAQETLDGIRSRDAERMSLMVDLLEGVFNAAGVPTGLDAAKVIARVAKRHGVDPATVVLQERHAAQAFQERLFEETTPEQRPDILRRVLSGGSQDAEGGSENQRSRGPSRESAPYLNPEVQIRGRSVSKANAEGGSDASPVKVQAEIRTHLMKAGKPAYVAEKFIDYDDALRLVLDLGGLPCYTAIVDGIKPITPFEATPETLIENIKAKGIWVTEFIPNRNDVGIMEEYVLKMRAAGLVVSAGTEHNTLDKISLQPVCAGKAPVPDNVAKIFWEGACVVVGHQAAVLAGRPGYLDDSGKPNPVYKDVEARIAAFKTVGEAAIAQARANVSR
jgi:hypothetical protein